MRRRRFLMGLSAFISLKAFSKQQPPLMEVVYFQDDGVIPNSKYPLIIYRKAFSETGSEGASWLEERFAKNNWRNSWRNGVYPFHHYHSISHEVLGIYSGSATLHLGGEKGKKLKVNAGDILIIPAGVGHKNLGDNEMFGVVGAYPNGHEWDLLKGEPGDRPLADKHIAAVPFPDTDPLLGNAGGLLKTWK